MYNFSAVSEWLKVPDTQFMLDHVRPDFLMLRVSNPNSECVLNFIEPSHDKTNKMACAPSED